MCWVWSMNGAGLDCGGCIGYEGGDDAAQVSIVKDIPLRSARNRSRPRSTINLQRWKKRRWGSSHRVRVTDAPLLRCEPAHVQELHEAANPPPWCLLENKQGKINNHMHTYTNICKQHFITVLRRVDYNIQFTFIHRLKVRPKDILFFNVDGLY